MTPCPRDISVLQGPQYSWRYQPCNTKKLVMEICNKGINNYKWPHCICIYIYMYIYMYVCNTDIYIEIDMFVFVGRDREGVWRGTWAKNEMGTHPYGLVRVAKPPPKKFLQIRGFPPHSHQSFLPTYIPKHGSISSLQKS